MEVSSPFWKIVARAQKVVVFIWTEKSVEKLVIKRKIEKILSSIFQLFF